MISLRGDMDAPRFGLSIDAVIDQTTVCVRLYDV